MKAADSAPSPSRFCSALGTRSAAVSASACGPTPKKKATVCSRARPDSRLSRMPAPTLAAPPPRAGRPGGGGCGGGEAATAAAGLRSTASSIAAPHSTGFVEIERGGSVREVPFPPAPFGRGVPREPPSDFGTLAQRGQEGMEPREEKTHDQRRARSAL